MESLLNRYRDVTVLVLVIMAQLVLLGYQVKTGNDVRMIRVWAVTAVTPVARILEGVRSGVTNFFGAYITLRDSKEQNRGIQEELARLKLENLFLKGELSTAGRAQALSVFQARTPSRTLASRVIGTGASTGSRVVFVDRGSVEGVVKGMAVITPDGIAGKVTAAYPTASQVALVTDSSFAAGVVSEKNRVHGILKGQGGGLCRIDRVPAEVKVEVGEWFYTSGDDRVFPKGMPAGRVKVVRPGSPFQEILLEPSGLQNGAEEVLIVLEGVHQQISELPNASPGVHLQSPPPSGAAEGEGQSSTPAGPGTEADRLRDHYKALGEAQGHKFGEGGPGAKPADFNAPIPAAVPAPKSPSSPPVPATRQ